MKNKISIASKKMWLYRREELLKTRVLKFLNKDPKFQANRLKSLSSPKFRQARSKLMKEKFRDPDFKEKVIKRSLEGLLKRPTKLEGEFISLIQKYNLPYRYVGNGSFLIGWKNPDFINTNGEKICIEVANRIHHTPDWAKKRIRHYIKWGWRCIILWQDNKTRRLEDDENLILEKIESIELDTKIK